MSIMRTNRNNGSIVITPTPNGVGWAGSMSNNYQQTQTQKNSNFDTSRKLVIQNYAKDLGMMVFWGWDILAAEEFAETYTFQLKHRSEPKLGVHITLGRELQQQDIKYPELFYQCYIMDTNDEWSETAWFCVDDLGYTNFWAVIEEIVDKHNPLLPF